MTAAREFDITIYGATGFTGTLITEYLASAYGQEIKLAIAARNQAKLDALKARFGSLADLATIAADADDRAALAALAPRTKVLIQAAGPYTLYGKNIVAACVAAGTDYVDLSGESNFQFDMMSAHQTQAEQTGARIVHSCGFDSVPSDLGIYRLQQIAQSETGVPFPRVKGRVEAMEGAASGGTVASIMIGVKAAEADPSVAEQLINPFALTPGFQGPQQPPGHIAVHDDELGTWAAPFIMAEINTKNVHRSNFLLNHAYGEDFLYDEMTVVGPGDEGKKIANMLAENPAGALMGEGAPPQPGEGPDKAAREAGHFKIAYYGRNDKGSAVVRVEGFQDPGYGSTSKQISEAALCLLQDQVSVGGGFWTPASAMGEQLIHRLSSNGVLGFAEAFQNAD